MTRLRVSPEAEEELGAAAEWYEERRAGLGVELVATIDVAVEEIVVAPLACPRWRADRPYRMKDVRRFPYVIFFDLRDDAVSSSRSRTHAAGRVTGSEEQRLGAES